VTFAVSWIAVLFVLGPDGFLSTTASSPAFALAGPASLLGPSLAAILLTTIVDGKAGAQDLVERARRWRVGSRWYAVALFTGPVVSTACLLSLSLVSTDFVPAILRASDKTGLLMAGMGAALVVSVFEELGWTGFATPRLRGRLGVVSTGVVMGVLWGLWHFPLFAGSAGSSGDVPRALYLAAMLFSWLVPYRVLMVWVHDRTRSMLIAVLMHAPVVVSQYALTPEGMSGRDMFSYLLLYGAALWAIVVWVTRPARGAATSVGMDPRSRPSPRAHRIPGQSNPALDLPDELQRPRSR
jgi:membrane protease YdiL (CAAX protease family)